MPVTYFASCPNTRGSTITPKKERNRNNKKEQARVVYPISRKTVAVAQTGPICAAWSPNQSVKEGWFRGSSLNRRLSPIFEGFAHLVHGHSRGWIGFDSLIAWTHFVAQPLFKRPFSSLKGAKPLPDDLTVASIFTR